MERFVDECVGLFVQRLNEVAATDSPINVQHWMQCYAFDVIGYVTVWQCAPRKIILVF